MTLLHLYWIFFSTAAITFGGGYAMIPLLSAALVPGALTAGQMADLVALAQMTPGAVGLNCATYVGFLQHSLVGSVVCTFALATPGVIFGTAAGVFRQAVKDSILFKACLRGIRPMVIGLIASVVVFFADSSLFTAPIHSLWTNHGQDFGLDGRSIAIFAVCLFLELRFKLSVLWLVLTAGAMGFILFLQ